MTSSSAINPANRLGLDYHALADAFGYTGPIIDIHSHLTGIEATSLYIEAADRFGIIKTFSMTNFEACEPLRKRWGDRIEFIAVPNYANRDLPGTFTSDWLERIQRFRDAGSRVIKFWAAPRGRDLGTGPDAGALRLDSPHREEQMALAYDLGYRVFMTHVADPDTWFAAKYQDAATYGTKAEQYPPLERALERYRDVTWIAAHMGGNPERLDFLQGLLNRHPNLMLDTSATKWMVRELSKHPREYATFLLRNADRILFGSDIVANDNPEFGGDPSFGLYASRYWALRTLIESDYEGESPIVDPDLHMVNETVPKDAAPMLRGAGVTDPEVLRAVYHGNAASLLPSAS